MLLASKYLIYGLLFTIKTLVTFSNIYSFGAPWGLLQRLPVLLLEQHPSGW